MKIKIISQKGFTLFELIVVLGILSAMVAIILPFCRKSHNGLKLKQVSENIAQVIRYGMDLAEKRKRTIKFIYNDKEKNYRLEMEHDQKSFKPVEDFTGINKFFNKNIHLFDIEGFEQSSQQYFLIFDPSNTLPSALIRLSSDNSVITIKVKSKYVQVQEENI